MCLAVPARVVERCGDALGVVDLEGLRREISLELTPEATVGDYVIVHVGYALAVLDTSEAKRALESIDEIRR